MQLCLYRHPTVTPDTPRLGVVREDTVVDVHLACLVSMTGHMKPRRAQEIATALAPPDLLGFVEGGRHAWNALGDGLVRLGRTVTPALEGPAGEPVVVLKGEVRLVPLIPPAAGWSGEAMGAWATTPVASPGSSTVVALHTDGQAYLPEYLAVVGRTAASVTAPEALGTIAFVASVRPSQPESACILHRPDSLPDDEPELPSTVARAVAAASRARTLYPGDVVRCGPPIVSRHVDLRPEVVIELDLDSDIVPTR